MSSPTLPNCAKSSMVLCSLSYFCFITFLVNMHAHVNTLSGLHTNSFSFAEVHDDFINVLVKNGAIQTLVRLLHLPNEIEEESSDLVM